MTGVGQRLKSGARRTEKVGDEPIIAVPVPIATVVYVC